MIYDVASFLRWRLKPNRWATKGLNSLADLPLRLGATTPMPTETLLMEPMVRHGYVKLDRASSVPEIDLSPYRGRARGKPFVDIKSEHRAVVTNTLVDLLCRTDVAALVCNYFEGRPWLWNFSLNYSDRVEGLTDSQMWHFDYGDIRQLHFLVYFSDVGHDCGPFTFLPTEYSDRVTRHPFIIERMTDEDLSRRFDIDVGASATRLIGKRGDVFANDPGRLMHQGARCTQPRLVLFATFTSRAPMSRGGEVVISRDERIALGEAYRSACADGAIPMSAFG